ncbi:RidA family protein [Jannaschia sp. CCS1]|uniref:RidA family protein n=1 Tax=Jannaschia sp. (strain CCS1) TaxID=290400 RepID=UPI000053BC09|nr:RidA family protein [Jannaschia sp. CCS1]ABD54026.1 Endoribonuclease L-PSP [Jannaschia sp. CCS1]
MTKPRAITPAGMEGYVDDWHMSPGLMVGDFLFLTGMTGAGPDGIVDPDPETQIRLAFQRADAVLQEAGLSFAHVVEMTSYHVGIASHIDAFRAIRSEYVAAPHPAWTAIEVAGFVTPGTVCELRIVAHRTPV